MIGLALFLTFFFNETSFWEFYTDALLPYFNGERSLEEMWEVGLEPSRESMLRNTWYKDFDMFVALR